MLSAAACGNRPGTKRVSKVMPKLDASTRRSQVDLATSAIVVLNPRAKYFSV